MNTATSGLHQAAERLEAGAAFLKELAAQGVSTRFAGRMPISKQRGVMVSTNDGAVALRLRGVSILLSPTVD